MVTEVQFIDAAGRGECRFWGKSSGPEVVLWDTLDVIEKQEWKRRQGNCNDYIIVRKRPEAQEKQVKGSLIRPPGRCALILGKDGQGSGMKGKRSGGSAPTGRGQRAKGWWSRGDIQAVLNEYDLECWVHG